VNRLRKQAKLDDLSVDTDRVAPIQISATLEAQILGNIILPTHQFIFNPVSRPYDTDLYSIESAARAESKSKITGGEK
jgi:hypothetical protein